MIKRTPKKRLKVSEVIGNKFTKQEQEKHSKFRIWTPENSDQMIVGNEPPLSISAFSTKLKKLDKRIFIHINKQTPSPEAPFGHAIRYKDEAVEGGHDAICGVGKGGEYIIPAMSKYNHFKNKYTNDYETRLDSLGWLAAEEMVINYLMSRNNKG